MITIKPSEFVFDSSLLDGTECYLVAKSQDQTIRRERLIKGMKGGKFGRTEQRPTAEGLLIRATLKDGEVKSAWEKTFAEPRHIIRRGSSELLLTDVNGLNILDYNGSLISRIENKFFAFLHSVDLCGSDENKVLITSSGYDAVVEIDLERRDHSLLWSAWEHGFNPDEDGNWLALTEEYYDQLAASGKKAVYIDPLKYGEQGINTKYRSAHPNVAVYNPYENDQSIVVSIGHNGEFYEISRADFSQKLVIDELSQMPHGLKPNSNGWYVTNTTKGELWLLDRNFNTVKKVLIKELEGKLPALKNVEWIQNTIEVRENVFICLDANRGLIALDLKERRINIFSPDPEWCLQDILVS